MFVQSPCRLITRICGESRISLAERRHLAWPFMQRNQLAGQHGDDCSGWSRNALPHAKLRDAFSNLAKTINTLIVPSSVGDVAGFVATALTVLERLRPAAARS
jgi:hypothetical protein